MKGKSLNFNEMKNGSLAKLQFLDITSIVDG